LAVSGHPNPALIEFGTAFLVLLILLVVYRNLVTMLLPLVTIGITLATAQGVLAGFAELGLHVSPETMVLMTAVVVGAVTDYAVFMTSRYHDYVRLGANSNDAVKRALTSIGKVIAASAATVAVAFLAMVFAHLPVFTTVGPAISIAVGVGFFAAVTLLPAIIVLAGPRGWIKPRRAFTTRFWRLSGIRIVRRPKIHLVTSLILLIFLAACASFVRYNYDDRKTLPTSTESAIGYTAMSRHFPSDALSAQFILIRSPNDLRTPQALADLEQMARRVSQVPGVALVRGITRPTGEPLEQAKATYQAGEIGGKLNEASQQINNHDVDLNSLTQGANTLADALGQVRGQVGQAIGTVAFLVDALSSVQNQLGGGQKALQELDNAAKLVGSMRGLGDAIGTNVSNIAESINQAASVVPALDASPACNIDPLCSDARVQLRRLATLRNEGTLDKIAELGRQLQSTQGGQSIDSTLAALRGALAGAENALQGLDQIGGLRERLATLQQGADALADGSRKLADGVAMLVEQTRRMGAGLGDASAFLLAMKNEAGTPSTAGFYVPPQLLTQDDFKRAAAAFVSPDGHTVRYVVQTQLDPFGTAAMDQVNAIADAARSAQPNTALADAKISLAGVSTVLRDTRDYYHVDFQFFVIATIAIVLLIMIVLLRAIVAALYLITSVIISYLSALGLGVIVFQFVLGQELHWSIPGLTFILLVAVGADYNLLLISRIREESPHGIRIGVIRTVGSTGAVITSAGLIFAASMFGLMFASITTMIQAGFVIGSGILLDTFVVRTITVPAMAVILSQANWWPYQWWPRRSRVRLLRRVIKRRSSASNAGSTGEHLPMATGEPVQSGTEPVPVAEPVPEAEPVQPDAEAVQPEAEAGRHEAEPVPEAEPVQPDAEAVQPDAEAVRPDAEAGRHEAEAGRHEAEPVPEAEPGRHEAEPVVCEAEPVLCEAEPVLCEDEPVLSVDHNHESDQATSTLTASPKTLVGVLRRGRTILGIQFRKAKVRQ
jgi:RND superfamily putative drug exporter